MAIHGICYPPRPTCNSFTSADLRGYASGNRRKTYRALRSARSWLLHRGPPLRKRCRPVIARFQHHTMQSRRPQVSYRLVRPTLHPKTGNMASDSWRSVVHPGSPACLRRDRECKKRPPKREEVPFAWQDRLTDVQSSLLEHMCPLLPRQPSSNR